MSTHSRSIDGTIPPALTEGHARGLFSAAAWSVGDADGPLRRGVLGTDRHGGDAIDDGTLFDLASVTKVAAGLVAAALIDSGDLTPATTVGSVLPDFADTDKTQLQLGDLMTHTSGIPGQVPLWRDHDDAESLRSAVGALPLAGTPGDAVRYSSQGLMLVGWMAERVSGHSLDELVAGVVAEPAGARTLAFNPTGPAVATEQCPWRGRLVQGQVHDENAVVLGGVAAHAGLFASLSDMEALGAALVTNLDQDLLLPVALFASMHRNRTAHLGHGRGWTWQHRDSPDDPYGRALPAEAFGHTGFTGTSVIVDPIARQFQILLTNRVHPTREQTGFAAVRRAFHSWAAPSVPPTA